MKQRCYDKKTTNYKNYGGRGITICDRWHKFENFLSDMGNPPTNKHQLDRIDNNKEYSPANCKWSTDYEQRRNQRRNVFITYNNKTLILNDWSKIVGIHRYCLYKRIFTRNWPIEKAMTTPSMKPKSKKT